MNVIQHKDTLANKIQKWKKDWELHPFLTSRESITTNSQPQSSQDEVWMPLSEALVNGIMCSHGWCIPSQPIDYAWLIMLILENEHE